MRDFSRVNIPAVVQYSIARPDNKKLACVLRAIFFATKNVHILRCRPLGRLVLPVRDASSSSSSDFFARGRRQDNTLDKGEYHVEALGRSAAYIRLKATVSEMSSRANSCIVKIKLCFFLLSSSRKRNKEEANEGVKTYKYTKKTCSLSLPEDDRNASACDDDDDEPSTPR